MEKDEIRETDMTYIEKLLSETREHAQTIRNKAFELNRRTAEPKEEKGTIEKDKTPQEDVGMETRKKLIRINTILVEAVTSLEAFV